MRNNDLDVSFWAFEVYSLSGCEAVNEGKAPFLAPRRGRNVAADVNKEKGTQPKEEQDVRVLY